VLVDSSRLPEPSNASPKTFPRLALVAGPPFAGSPAPPPAKVVIFPSGAILRTRSFSVSAT